MIGRQLGPYTIVAPLGAGGMGEVYRARDSKLGRDVAIKILPSRFTSDPERRSRFAREARLLATLNHPSIGAIYGLEETDGVTALVLELVEGPTLADSLARGPMPIADALTIARQIAEALDTAHQKGIIHRDLKPANIALQGAAGGMSSDLRAKVLDFGLAKTFADHAEPADLPTLTSTGTHEGRLLGTPAYMSPEQARGQAVDKRTDIWAFGCVLYEMLTARRAFPGATMSDQLAAILDREPDWTALPAATSTATRRLLTRCLEKDQGRRLRDIGDARLELDEKDAQPVPQGRPSRRLWSLAFAGALLAKPTKGGGIMYPQALPGGRTLLYTETAGTTDSGEIMLLDVGTRKSTPLRSGSAARYLPSGHLVFVSGTSLLAVAFDVDRLQMRGAAVPILTGIRVNPEVGAAQVAFSDSSAFAYLPVASTQRTLVWVDRQGQETAVAAPPRAYSIPRVSPDGTRVGVSMKEGGQDIYLWDVSRSLLRQLTFDASPNTALAWLDNDRLVFSATVDGWGHTFERRADGLGEPRQITSGLPSFPSAASRDGALLIVREYPPDGGWDIGVVPLQTPERRQTVERTKASENNPVLSPDGRWLAYQSNKTGRYEVYVRPLPLSGTGEIAVTAEGGTRPVWSRDGSELYYWTASRTAVAIKAIRITSGPPSSWSAPSVIVEGPYVTTSHDTEYDVWEGRFLLMKDFTADGLRPGREIVVVQNWFEELGRLVKQR